MVITTPVSNVTVEEVSIHLLQPHPRNVEIYGLNEDISELARKIEEKGKFDYHIVVTQHNRIISGHRRWQAAKHLKWSTVPIERRTYVSELEELEALLIANVYRDKTTAQRTREYEVWLEIYKERNKEKQESQGEYGKDGGRISKLEEIKQRNGQKAEDHVTLQANLPEGLGTQNPNKRKNTSKPQSSSQSRDQAANDAGLKARTADKSVKVLARIKDLQQKGMTEVAKTLEAELNRSVDAAMGLIKLTEEGLFAALRKLASNEVKTGKAAVLKLHQEQIEAQVQAAPSKPCITLASAIDWLPRQPLCDLLLTDPPYSTDVQDIEVFAHTWLPLALQKVKASGRAYVCIGAYPEELRAYLNVPAPPHLKLSQVLVWTYKNTLGPKPAHTYKQNWQAILYYVGESALPLDCPVMKEQWSCQDLNAPDGRQGDRYHAWQKPDQLAEQLIRHSTRPGDTVIDCFVGTGTFVLAAHRLGRKAIGCEQEEAMAEIARTRGCEVATCVLR
jgi:ParB-like chromosome segregation protein Spo0J